MPDPMNHESVRRLEGVLRILRNSPGLTFDGCEFSVDPLAAVVVTVAGPEMFRAWRDAADRASEPKVVTVASGGENARCLVHFGPTTILLIGQSWSTPDQPIEEPGEGEPYVSAQEQDEAAGWHFPRL